MKRGVLTVEPVRVKLPAKDAMLPSVPCRVCAEPFLTTAKAGEALCQPCGGQSYYEAGVHDDSAVEVPAAESCAR